MKFVPDGLTDEQRDVIRKLEGIADPLGNKTKKAILRPENPKDDRKPMYMAEVSVDENNEWRLRALIEHMTDSDGYGISMEEVKNDR